MKSLFGKVEVILIGLIIFGYAEAWGADWIFFSSTDYETLYYDAENITRPSKDVVRVWGKVVYNEKGVIDVVRSLGDKFKTLGYMKELLEIHCTEKKWCLLAFAYYSTDERLLPFSNLQEQESKWEFIIPESTTERLYKILCE